MLQTINCIKLGQILLDENQQLFILCHNCHKDLINENDFRRHLEQCDGVENLFKDRHQLKFNAEKNSTQLFGKTSKGIKEFLIYDYPDVELEFLKTEEHFIDLINIEHELLDPKWYSDFDNTSQNPTTKKQSYDVLVEEVTPFVQFKENVKSNIRTSDLSSIAPIESGPRIIKNVDLTTKREKTMKRKLSAVKFSNESLQTKEKIYLLNSPAPSTHTIVKRAKIANHQPVLQKPTASLASNSRSTTLCAPKPSKSKIAINALPPPVKAHIPVVKPANQPTKETAKILNKLQNLSGLQIKRTAATAPPLKNPPSNKTDNKTLEIINKLQSKGMKVKLVNKPRMEIVGSSINNMTVNENFNKNLIIRKVN